MGKQAMSSTAQKSSRALVRELLLEPLEHLGLARPRNLKVEQFNAMLDQFVKRFAYMRPDSLERLRLVVESNLDGRNHDHWPAPAAVYKWARDIEPEPDVEPDLVVSWLRSVEGPIALEAGFVVELRGYLRRFRRPPSSIALDQIRARAEANATRRTLIREQENVGRASEEDLRWVDEYWAAHRICEDIVNSRHETGRAE